jgi:hypothetical protein
MSGKAVGVDAFPVLRAGGLRMVVPAGWFLGNWLRWPVVVSLAAGRAPRSGRVIRSKRRFRLCRVKVRLGTARREVRTYGIRSFGAGLGRIPLAGRSAREETSVGSC